MRAVALVLAYSFAATAPAVAETPITCASALTKKSDPTAVIMCLQDLQKELNAKVARVPDGAVVAFDRPDGCPIDQGWVPFDAAAGRMIVGVGERVGREGEYLLPYVEGEPRYQTGGEETHTLKPEEMPRHKHQFSRTSGDSPGTNAALARDTQGRMANFDTTFSGGDLPHNNMPPYVALYFCKKEG